MDQRAFELMRELAGQEPVSVRVRGECMRPLVANGASVKVRAHRFYTPGQIIVFRTPAGDLAAHRLLGYRSANHHLALVTKGDHCDTHDAPVPMDQIVGAIERSISLRDLATALGAFFALAFRRVTR